MPSQFFGLYISSSGLRTSNAALNTTANNIANAQTVGYSRQQVVQEANDPLRVFSTYGCAGAGVDVIAIERIRNHFYDVKFWNNQSRLGKYEVQNYYTRTLEDYFEDDDLAMPGFNTLFNRMSAALQDVHRNPSDTSTQAAYIASLKAMTDYFNNMYGNLQELQNDLNLEIKQAVDEINSIAEKIAILNKQINVIEMSGGGAVANELRDQREKLVDRLSLLVDVEIDEFPVYDVSDPTRLTGAHIYSVKINGGQILTYGNEYNQLLCQPRKDSEKINQTDIDGLFDVKWANGNDFGLQSAVMSGTLRGLVEMRDGNNGFYFNGKVGKIESGYDADNNRPISYVTVNITDVSLLDMKLCNLSDTGGKITLGGRVYHYTDWTFNRATGEYVFTMTETVDSSRVGKEAAVGDAVNYQGIPYYMTQMNAWLRGFSEKVNSILHGDYVQATDPITGDLLFDPIDGSPIMDVNVTGNGFDVSGEIGAFVFTGNKHDGKQYGAAELVAGFGKGLYAITAGNVAINNELMSNAARLGTKSTESIGVEERGPIDLMIQLLNSKEMFSYRNGTAKDFLQMLLGDIALNASNAQTFYNTYKGLANAIDNQRNSVSGVDEDEEAVNLVKFQNAYNLSSRMIQTFSEIYNRLILQTGI